MYSSGDRYEGYFKDGRRTGKGVFISANGTPSGLEFEEKTYFLEELEFKDGTLVSATARSNEEEETEPSTEDEEYYEDEYYDDLNAISYRFSVRATIKDCPYIT
ncbi:MAG: hypothetical protein B6247_10585 [Candidatus Parabeggiatoa sp. nov. 2]|nr:MAG: hypothetical protein B6247_10585 [Beggiatoa sp. 4572_84]